MPWPTPVSCLLSPVSCLLLLLSLNDRAYGMPSRLQDAAGSRNRRKDAALEAVGIPLATEFRDSCSRR